MNNIIQVTNVYDQAEGLQELVEKEAGVRCSILVTPKTVWIKTTNYRDFALARSVIRQRVKQEVCRDLE